jgi:hypothetical protein
VWPLLIRAATCAESSGGYASKHGVCSSFSFHFSLPKNRMLYVGTALAWVPPFFNVGKFICTAAMFLCFTPTAAIMCILTAAMFGARKYEWLLTSHSIPVQTISKCDVVCPW